MIRIYRPAAEPPGLRTQREEGLRRAIAAYNDYGETSYQLKDTLTAYDGGKEDLFRAQHKKCAFCDRMHALEGNCVEHFRPKARVWRHVRGGRRLPAEPGYWWLTWSWSNHLFSCSSCNTGRKSSYFPLSASSGRLSGPLRPFDQEELLPQHQDLSVESPLLVDPSTDDPLDHIEWKPVKSSDPKKRWLWSASHLTERGEATIRVLQLVSHAANIVGPHLRDHVLRHTEEICAYVDNGQYGLARLKWEELTSDVTRADCDLAGATWSALHRLVDEARRTAANLLMPPRPGSLPPAQVP